MKQRHPQRSRLDVEGTTTAGSFGLSAYGLSSSDLVVIVALLVVLAISLVSVIMAHR